MKYYLFALSLKKNLNKFSVYTDSRVLFDMQQTNKQNKNKLSDPIIKSSSTFSVRLLLLFCLIMSPAIVMSHIVFFLFWIHLSYLAFPHLKLIFFSLTNHSLTNNFNHSNGRTHHFLRLWFMFLQCNRIFQNLSFTHTLSPPQFCDEIITHKKHTSLARVINKTFIINDNALLSKLLLTHLLQTIILFCLNSNHH